MTFDDLRLPWQNSNGGSVPPEKREELVARVCRRVERLGATILHRDIIETVVAVAVVFIFSRMCFELDHPLAKVGAAILVISACYTVYKLHRTRMDRQCSPLDAPVRDFCNTEVERLDRQIQLLRSVLVWYISPILLGANLVFFGTQGVGFGSVAYSVFTILIGWWINSLNQKAVTKSLLPVRDELAGLLHELNEKEA